MDCWQRHGLRADADTPPFLLQVHASAMEERAERGGKVEHKVRQIARRAMSREGRGTVAVSAVSAETADESPADAESGWKQPEIRS